MSGCPEVVLERDNVDQLDILPLSHGHSNKYSDRVNPTIFNGFATAAFSFGHTLVRGRERLKMIYDDVDNIDLFIGGISESHVSGSLLGPTFQCIVGNQFKRLHHGDSSVIIHNC